MHLGLPQLVITTRLAGHRNFPS